MLWSIPAARWPPRVWKVCAEAEARSGRRRDRSLPGLSAPLPAACHAVVRSSSWTPAVHSCGHLVVQTPGAIHRRQGADCAKVNQAFARFTFLVRLTTCPDCKEISSFRCSVNETTASNMRPRVGVAILTS
jgi:hypothetical protein